MATATILGLDIGGANLKAATPDKRAASVPFALWKQPDRLPAALAELVARFPDADELAVTMTGELCDCFETKREGVAAIIAAVRFASAGRRVHVWGTDGAFLDPEQAKRNHLKVASANWHALATLAGQYVPHGRAILIDVGSTTSDIIPILDGLPVPQGKTDYDRLKSWELLYTGVRRSPMCALMGFGGAAELFATTLDAYLTLGLIAEDQADCDTADGRPATKANAHARLSRMLCGDPDTIPAERTEELARFAYFEQLNRLKRSEDVVWGHLKDLQTSHDERSFVQRLLDERVPPDAPKKLTHIVSGVGEFLARTVSDESRDATDSVSLADKLGHDVSACAPAYAVAVLAAEAR